MYDIPQNTNSAHPTKTLRVALYNMFDKTRSILVWFQCIYSTTKGSRPLNVCALNPPPPGWGTKSSHSQRIIKDSKKNQSKDFKLSKIVGMDWSTFIFSCGWGVDWMPEIILNIIKRLLYIIICIYRYT